MKLMTTLYRVTTIRTAELIAAVGKDPDTEITGSELNQLVKEKFGPLAPRFRIFVPPDSSVTKTIVGCEAMCFDVPEANVPMAGLVMVDPMEPKDVDRIDGAIESELNRLGLGTEWQGYEWRFYFRTLGN